MVEPLRHRQTKGAETDMFYLTPPRHISLYQSLPKWAVRTMSGLPPLATELRTSLVVRLVPNPEVAV
jgi:hypothetical protein